MFSLDDRAGNVITTVALFLVAATILYVARGAFFVLLLSILFAYLLEPAVTWVQKHPRLRVKNRTWAIAQVYVIGILLLGSLGYEFAPHLAAQMRSLNAAVPQILQGLSSGRAAANLGAKHGLTAAKQQRIQDWLTRNHAFFARAFESGTASAASVTASAIWLFAIPVLAIFILKDGRQMLDATIEGAELRGRRTAFERILRQIDTMLAKYMRAQLALAGLSVCSLLQHLYASPWIPICFGAGDSGRSSGVSAGGGMDCFGRNDSDDRLPYSFTLDLDGRASGCVESCAELCHLSSHHG